MSDMNSGASKPLTRQQKAAVIIGVLGAEAAGPVLEQFDENSLRHFTHAMSGLKRIDATAVRATIAEFLSELQQERGFALLLATHNERLARACDRVLRLENGGLVQLDDQQAHDYFNRFE